MPSGWPRPVELGDDSLGRIESRLTTGPPPGSPPSLADDPNAPRRMAARPPADAWFDVNWNPITGCAPVSPGCAHCEAMQAAAELARMGGRPGARYVGLTRAGPAGLAWSGEVRFRDELLAWPVLRASPRRILLGSMSDLFHEHVALPVLDRLHAVIAVARWHRFLVLTKRAERMRDYYADPQTPIRVAREIEGLPAVAAGRPSRRSRSTAARRARPGCVVDGPGTTAEAAPPAAGLAAWPLPNLWLGVSVEDHDNVGRVAALAETPAALRWVCFEPLLGPVRPDAVPLAEGYFDALRGMRYRLDGRGRPIAIKGPRSPALDWVVAGGEIGAGARPTQPDWLRRVRDLCAAAQVPFFFKQWGEWAPAEEDEFGRRMVRRGRRTAGRLLDGDTWDRLPRR